MTCPITSNRFLIVIIIILFGIAIPHIGKAFPNNEEPSNISQDTLIGLDGSVEIKSDMNAFINFLFPDENLISINNASSLAREITNKLELTLQTEIPTPSVVNPSFLTLLDRSNGSLNPSKYLFDIESDRELWYHSMTFECSNGSNISLYYREKDGDSCFVAFRAILSPNANDNPISPIEQINAITSKLQLPLSGLEQEIFNSTGARRIIPTTDPLIDPDWENHSIIIWDNATIFRFYMRYMGFPLDGCNQIAFSFNQTGLLNDIQCTFFSTIHNETILDFETAMSKCRQEVNILLYDQQNDFLAYEEIFGYRIMPFCNGSESPKGLSLILQYQAIIRNQAQSYFITIGIDAKTSEIVFSMRGPPATEILTPIRTNNNTILVFVGLLGVSIFLIGCIMLGPPEFSSLFFASLIVPMYMRLKSVRIFDNFNRGRIYEYIARRPGCSLSEIGKELSMMNGNLCYHLAVLKRTGLIRSIKDSRERKFFVIGVTVPTFVTMNIGHTGSLIIAALRENEPITEKQLAISLDMSRQRVHYHLKKLEKKRMIIKSENGWRLPRLNDD